MKRHSEKTLSGRFGFCLAIATLLLLAGCGVDPDDDGFVTVVPDAIGDSTADTDEGDVDPGDTSEEVLEDVETVDDGADTAEDTIDGGDEVLPDATIETCNGHCDCDGSEFCSNTGTCQPIVGPDVYYCCDDSGPACPEGQACHIPGTFGNSGTCGE